MSNNMLFDSLHGGLSRAIELRLQKHEITASNLANIDTPNFQGTTLDFDAALRDAVGTAGQRGGGMAAVEGDACASGELIQQDPLSWAGDNSSVYLERENAAMLSNSLQLNALTDGMSRRLAMLRFAATNGGG